MVLWPAVALIGFLVLTAFVIAMATHSTARYEREQRTENATRTPEPVGALTA
jgi:multisubunit Na+/H+ antiporter MnhC subunit